MIQNDRFKDKPSVFSDQCSVKRKAIFRLEKLLKQTLLGREVYEVVTLFDFELDSLNYHPETQITGSDFRNCLSLRTDDKATSSTSVCHYYLWEDYKATSSTFVSKLFGHLNISEWYVSRYITRDSSPQICHYSPSWPSFGVEHKNNHRWPFGHHP